MSARPSGYQQFKDEQVNVNIVKQKPEDVQAGTLCKGGNADFPIDQIPPNFELAELHSQAWNVGTTKLSKSQKRKLQRHQSSTQQNNQDDLIGKICDCCARQVPNHLLSIGCNNKDYSFLGAGMPLYFEYIKSCILMLLIMFVTSGDYNIITNIAFGTSCKALEDHKGQEIDEKTFCQRNWVTESSLANKRNGSEFIDLQQMLNLISMITLIILFQYFRKEQRAFDAEIDSQTQYASDFTVLLKNIPTDPTGLQNGDFDDDLKNFMEQHISKYKKLQEIIDYEQDRKQYQIQTKKPVTELKRVVAVNLCYNLDDQYQLEKSKQAKIVLKQKILSNLYGQGKDPLSSDVKSDPQVNQIDNEISEIENQLEALEKRFTEGKDVKNYFLGQAFVTFQWENDVQQLLEEYKLSKIQRLFGKKSQLVYRGANLIVEEPPEPTDVFWENLHITTKSKVFRRLFGYAITALILILCAGLIYWLSAIQAESAEEQALAVKQGDLKPNIKVKIIAQVASISIIVINALLAMFIKNISLFEKFSTQTGFNISLASKSSMAQFINTAVITFAISTWVTKNIYGAGGLVYNQTYVFISNAFIPGIIQLIDAGTISKWLFQYLEKKKGSKSIKTQQQLHELFEKPVFDISTAYATILKNMYVVAFYASVIPLALVITCVALLVHYWVEKYNIARRRTIKYNYSSQMSIEMIEQLELVLPIYCMTNLWWEYVFLESISTEAIIGICLGVGNAILPMHEINESMFSMKSEIDEHLPIQEAETGFLTDYCRENPATAETARQQYKIRVEKHKQQKLNMDKMFGDQ
ncbi:unnamed protein product (macronuclear) [Paramecium tetraurelia]|uniref:CSC1/OSCA1-like cytosolic domain-containing protein n=1 Tax=Paramecium tetraurelia TaxID=5888 RepID=A0BIM6_PARTE|nr:uncharacterized protein GSPATT00004765001 [Paramecium tetraurelia]CAK58393.1 unnamed protein product [Paramecium tetraurelia]|eukprot:XP_001425791.1 hypothetical protein (macronuclear) [Paramecium tetraurelia strain d4-2]